MNPKLDLNCPECQTTMYVTMDDIARQRTVRCNRGHSVRLVDQDGGFRSAAKAMDDLERTIKNFGR